MPLDDYGVLVGRFNRFEAEDENEYGDFLHGMVYVDAPPPGGGAPITWRSAVDVNAPTGPIQYLNLRVEDAKIASVLALSDGYHELASTSTSGAVDYVRSPWISVPLGCAALWAALWAAITRQPAAKVWRESNGHVALDVLRDAMPAAGQKVLVFGEPFQNSNGERGMHDVHMNQGDPHPAPGEANYNQKLHWYQISGIWQDGAVMVPKSDETTDVFLVKFTTQSMNTNDQGHPV